MNLCDLVPSSTFMYLWAIYIFPGSVCLFGCSKIGRPTLGIYNHSQIHECGNWETENYNSVCEITRPGSFISSNTSIGTRQFILDSQRPFICSVELQGWNSPKNFYHQFNESFTWLTLVSLYWQVVEATTASAAEQPWGDCRRYGKSMDQIYIKTPNPKCHLYWCLIDSIELKIQSCWYFRPLLWTNAPLTFSLVHLSPLPCGNKYRGMYSYSV